MPYLNKYEVMGHLGRDPEVRYTQSGKAVVSFSVATSKRYGETQYTTWHNIKAWGDLAEWVGANLSKGSLVYIIGEMTMNEWTTKEGEKRKTAELLANFISASMASARREGPEKVSEKSAWNDEDAEVPPDDIPF